MKNLFLLSILIICFSQLSFATTFIVNSSNDTNDSNINDHLCLDSSENCTLRAAIQQANASAGDDSITFNFNSPEIISLTIGELLINSNITITGTGARNLTIQRSTALETGNFRIFNISGSVGTAVTINAVSIANGNVANGESGANDFVGGGVAIFPDNLLNLADVTIKNNTANYAGGIFNGGVLNMTRSSIISNFAIQGGAINQSGGDRTVSNLSNSTISNNSANDSGMSGGVGGGVVVYNGECNLTNVTVSNNKASAGGGVVNVLKTTKVRNTIIANNIALSGNDPDIRYFSSPFTSLGNNLIGKNGCNCFINGVNGDKVGTVENPLDPLLTSLGNYGGQTDTQRLLPESPAIDAGNNCVVTANCPTNNIAESLATDQRGTGFFRQRDGNRDGVSVVDIGAFEVQAMPTAASVSILGRVLLQAEGRGLSRAFVYLTDQNGETRTAITNSFGYYHFNEVNAGQTYVLNVLSKRYSFSPRVITINEGTNDLDFIAQP